MQFKIKKLPQLLQERTFENIRLYDGKPSVTSVLKILEDSEAMKSFKAFNINEFNAMMKKAADRWTKLHSIIEQSFINNRFIGSTWPIASARMRFYTKEWHNWKHKHLEYKLIWEHVGWTIDAIMSIDNTDTIVDRKSCWVRVYDELIFKYKLQLSMYNYLYNKVHSNEPTTHWKIVLLSTAWWYKIVDITATEMDEYLDIYMFILEQFNEYYDQYLTHIKDKGNVSTISEIII